MWTSSLVRRPLTWVSSTQAVPVRHPCLAIRWSSSRGPGIKESPAAKPVVNTPSQRPWSEEETKRLFELREHSNSAIEIGLLLGRTKHSINYRLRAGPVLRDRRAWTSQDDAQLLHYQEQGLGCVASAERLHRSGPSVRRRLERLCRTGSARSCSRRVVCFTKEEDQDLLRLRDQGVSWRDIVSCFPQRSFNSLAYRAQALIRAKKPSFSGSGRGTVFTTEEMILLLRLRKDEQLPWSTIANHFPERTIGALKTRLYRSAGTTGVVHKMWTADEEKALLRLVAAGHTPRTISAIMTSRSLTAVKTKLYTLSLSSGTRP